MRTGLLSMLALVALGLTLPDSPCPGSRTPEAPTLAPCRHADHYRRPRPGVPAGLPVVACGAKCHPYHLARNNPDGAEAVSGCCGGSGYAKNRPARWPSWWAFWGTPGAAAPRARSRWVAGGLLTLAFAATAWRSGAVRVRPGNPWTSRLGSVRIRARGGGPVLVIRGRRHAYLVPLCSGYTVPPVAPWWRAPADRWRPRLGPARPLRVFLSRGDLNRRGTVPAAGRGRIAGYDVALARIGGCRFGSSSLAASLLAAGAPTRPGLLLRGSHPVARCTSAVWRHLAVPRASRMPMDRGAGRRSAHTDLSTGLGVLLAPVFCADNPPRGAGRAALFGWRRSTCRTPPPCSAQVATYFLAGVQVCGDHALPAAAQRTAHTVGRRGPGCLLGLILVVHPRAGVRAAGLGRPTCRVAIGASGRSSRSALLPDVTWLSPCCARSRPVRAPWVVACC